MRLSLVISILMITLQCMAAQDIDVASCEGSDSGTYFQACMLAKNTKELDAQLNARYQELLKRYSEARLVKERRLLVEAQRVWIRYRDGMCKFENQAIGGINAISWASCQHRLTGERLEYLDAL